MGIGFGFGFGFAVGGKGLIGSNVNLSDSILDKLLFIGNYSEIVSGKMPNKLTGSSDWLTVSGSVGLETYQCPNTAPYIAADTDLIWFNSSGVQRNVLSSDLVGYDLQRTPIKYSDNSPYNINSIAILKSGETLTTDELNELHTKFRLPLYWSGILNENGVLKGNRGLSQSVWVIPPTGLTLSLISGGVKIDWINDSANQTEIWGKSDDGTYTLLYTIAAGTVTKSETINPVSLRYYEIRSKKGTAYSSYTLEASIAMLGAEMINQSSWNTSGYWNTIGANWSANGIVLTSNGGTGLLLKNSFWNSAKKYIAVTTLTGTGNIYQPYGGAAPINGAVAPGVKTEYIYPSSENLYIYSSSLNGTITDLSIKEILMP